MDPLHISCLSMACIAGFILAASLVAGSVAPVRACPEPEGACSCDATERSVTCTRLGSLIRRLPVGIPVNTRKLIVNYSTLNRLGPHAFRNCYLLEWVNLNNNRLEVISPLAFLSLNHLRVLLLSNNRISFLKEDVFTHLKNIHHLDLSNNRLIVLTSRNFAKLKNLLVLDLRNNPTMCIAPDAFAGLRNLEELQISNMHSSLNKEIFYDSPELTRLSITNFDSITQIPKYFFKNNKKLQVLRFENLPSLSNDGIPEELFTGLEELRTLSLKACNLTSVPRAALDRVKWSLREIDLSMNPLMRLHTSDLTHLHRLQEVNLRSTGLLSIEEKALDLNELHTFDISSNSLSTLKRTVFGLHYWNWQNVSLGNNPWVCDCQLRWMVRTSLLRTSTSPVECAEPPNMQGRDITNSPYLNIDSKYFACKTPNITEFGIQPGDVKAQGSPRSLFSLSAVCQATGYPKPTIQWVLPVMGLEERKNRENSLKYNSCHVCEPSSVHPHVDIQVDADGTLMIVFPQRSVVAGTYTCRAVNKVGVTEKSFVIKRSVDDEHNRSLSTHREATASKNQAKPQMRTLQPSSSESGANSEGATASYRYSEKEQNEGRLMPVLPLLEDCGVCPTQDDLNLRREASKSCKKLENHPVCESVSRGAGLDSTFVTNSLSKKNNIIPVVAGSSKPNGNTRSGPDILLLVSLTYASITFVKV